MSEGSVQPVSPYLRSEPWIISHLCNAVLPNERNWLEFVKNYDNIRDLMSRGLFGFEVY